MPTKNTWGNNLPFGGTFYRVRVSFPEFGGYSPDILSDASDNLFTINAPVGVFPPGCTSAIGYSVTTGQACDGSQATLQIGDVNGDGIINCTDSTWITESVLQNRTLTAEQKKRADMNGDGSISTLDAVLLSQKYGLNCSTATPSITVLSPNGGKYIKQDNRLQ